MFVGVIFASNTNFVLSQSVSEVGTIDLRVTRIDTSALSSSTWDKEGNRTDGNTILAAAGQ